MRYYYSKLKLGLDYQCQYTYHRLRAEGAAQAHQPPRCYDARARLQLHLHLQLQVGGAGETHGSGSAHRQQQEKHRKEEDSDSDPLAGPHSNLLP